MSKFRDFEFRGDPNVYINREIQEVPVLVYSTAWVQAGVCSFEINIMNGPFTLMVHLEPVNVIKR